MEKKGERQVGGPTEIPRFLKRDGDSVSEVCITKEVERMERVGRVRVYLVV